MRRKKYKGSRYLNEDQALRVTKTLNALNKLAGSYPYATISGPLAILIEDAAGADIQYQVGRVFFHAPVDGYVIEWAS